MRKALPLFLVVAGPLVMAPAYADDTSGVEFSGSGFLTVGVGHMLGGTRANVADRDCPCFIADYAQAGVYDGRGGLQWKPDTKLGLQGSAYFANRRLSITSQVVSRGARDGKVNLEWLYAGYKLTDNVTIQVGRKRLPMFYYSDTQDIGFALPWAHLPPQLYGWDAVNYNGVNVAVQHSLNDWSATLNVLAGSETFKDSGYWKIYLGRQSKTDVKWKNIFGADLTLSKDWLETRLVFIQSDTQTKIVDKGTWDPTVGAYDGVLDTEFFPDPPFKQRIHGLAINVDRDNWLLRGEWIRIDRPGQSFRDYATIVGAGYRWGKWQPFVTYSRYWGQAVEDRFGNPPDSSALEGHDTLALTLRYDLTTSSALKLQYDHQTDRSGPNWSPNYGDSRLLTATYDMVF